MHGLDAVEEHGRVGECGGVEVPPCLGEAQGGTAITFRTPDPTPVSTRHG
jgi:hypothetical protein